MPSVFITGTNRGLGLEWTRQYAEEGWRVYASCRHPADADELGSLSRDHASVTIHRLDVTRADDIRAIIWEMEGKPVDVLICNAAIYLEKGLPEFGCLRYSEWDDTFEVNTKGAIRVMEALVENVAMSERKLITVISSHMGSITDIQAPGGYYYRSSKAALNAVVQGLSIELRSRGIGILILHPGGVKTRMGPRNGITPEQSVAGMRNMIENFTIADTGCFFRYDGERMPW